MFKSIVALLVLCLSVTACVSVSDSVTGSSDSGTIALQQNKDNATTNPQNVPQQTIEEEFEAAIKAEDLEKVSALLKRGIDVEGSGKSGKLFIDTALETNNADIVLAMADSAKNAGKQNFGTTILQRALANASNTGSLILISQLLQNSVGTAVTAEADSNRTSIEFNNHVPIAEKNIVPTDSGDITKIFSSSPEGTIVTTETRSVNGNTTTITLNEGSENEVVFKQVRNSRGWLIEETVTRPERMKTSYQYDGSGNVTTMDVDLDINGRLDIQVYYTYDSRRRLTLEFARNFRTRNTTKTDISYLENWRELPDKYYVLFNPDGTVSLDSHDLPTEIIEFLNDTVHYEVQRLNHQFDDMKRLIAYRERESRNGNVTTRSVTHRYTEDETTLTIITEVDNNVDGTIDVTIQQRFTVGDGTQPLPLSFTVDLDGDGSADSEKNWYYNSSNLLVHTMEKNGETRNDTFTVHHAAPIDTPLLLK